MGKGVFARWHLNFSKFTFLSLSSIFAAIGFTERMNRDVKSINTGWEPTIQSLRMQSPSSSSKIGLNQMIKKITTGMKWEAKAIPHQPEALNCIGDETSVYVRIHEDGKDGGRIGLVGGFDLDEGGEEGGGGVLALSGDEEAEEGVGMGEEMVGAEVGHGGVGMEGEAEGGVEGDPVEEEEEEEGERREEMWEEVREGRRGSREEWRGV